MSRMIVGTLLGDHAGVGPEVTVRAMEEFLGRCVFLVIANGEIFRDAVGRFAPALTDRIETVDTDDLPVMQEDRIYLIDLPVTGSVPKGEISAASGQLMIDSMLTACGLKKKGLIDGLFLGPLTKASLHEADPEFQEEAQLFANEFGVEECGAYVKCTHILRATVTGHCPFRDIVRLLTPESIYRAGLALFDLERIFGKDRLGMAVAALNPHGGEGGLFGDEEARVIEPAIEMLRETLQVPVIGPCPADTVLQRCIHKEVGGLLYLFHDQGNLAIKSYRFNDGVTCFVKLPCMVTSPGHGSALDIAWKGVADTHNAKCAFSDLFEMIAFEKEGGIPWKYSSPELYGGTAGA